MALGPAVPEPVQRRRLRAQRPAAGRAGRLQPRGAEGRGAPPPASNTTGWSAASPTSSPTRPSFDGAGEAARADAEVRRRARGGEPRRAARDRAGLHAPSRTASSAAPTPPATKAAMRASSRSSWRSRCARARRAVPVRPRRRAARRQPAAPSQSVARARSRARGERRNACEADAVVVACGSYSAPLLRTVGVDLPIYPGKGYSATFKLQQARTRALRQHHRRRGEVRDEPPGRRAARGRHHRAGGLRRVAGLTRWRKRVAACWPERIEEVLPGVCDTRMPEEGGNPHFWTGLRPATPTNIPYIGRTKVRRPLGERRPRHAGLDAWRRLGQGDGRADQRHGSRGWRSTSMAFEKGERRFEAAFRCNREPTAGARLPFQLQRPMPRQLPNLRRAVSGICNCAACTSRPARANASATAFTTLGVAPMVPSSPTPLTPSGLFLQGIALVHLHDEFTVDGVRRAARNSPSGCRSPAGRYRGRTPCARTAPGRCPASRRHRAGRERSSD